MSCIFKLTGLSQYDELETKSMIGIDLFSGAGGMSVGARSAGVEISYAVESNLHAASTYSKNHPDTPIIAKDIRCIKKIPKTSNTGPIVLFGGPPCQGFSTSNQRTRSSNNPANWLYREFMRFVRKIRPDFVVFENVKGIVETENGSFINAILNDFSDAGYSTTHGVLNSSDFGVPQKRFRLFVIASLNGHVDLPKADPGSPVTVWDAIGDLPELENAASISKAPYSRPPISSYAAKLRKTRKTCLNNLVTNNGAHIVERYRHIPQGGNWKDIPARYMKNYADRSRCHTIRRLIVDFLYAKPRDCSRFQTDTYLRDPSGFNNSK